MIQRIYLMLKLYMTKNSFKAKALVLLCFFSFSFMSASGFDGSTLVTTASGRLKPIKELQVGDEVICYNSNLEPEINHIKGVYSFMVDVTINITTEDNISMTTGLMERFYLPVENQWVCAKDLKQGDCFLNEDLENVAITNVEKCEGQDVMFLITVDNQHNFLASEGKYLVHNGAGGAALGVFLGGGVVQATYWGFTGLLTVVCGPAGPAVAGVWIWWTAAPLAIVTKTAALAGGIALGVATGPV